jgi:hypothetical protein
MKNILFYGNCQPGSLYEIMRDGLKKYKISVVLCWADTKIDKNYFTSLIQNSDVIITQPIQPNYNNVDYLNTEYVLTNAKKTAQIFIFPSLYFDCYYPDLTYYHNNDKLLREPSDYHYNKLIETYCEGKDKNYFIEHYFNNLTYKTVDDLLLTVNNSLEELEKRENTCDKYMEIIPCKIIKIMSYIKNNYKQKLLFYSMNHPSKYLFQYIAKIIFTDLDIDTHLINYNVDPLFVSERGLLYKCIQQIVDFDIETHKPHLSCNNFDDVNKIIETYFNHYKKINLQKNTL